MPNIFRLAAREIQDFIRSNESLDERELVLKHKEILGVPASLLANQISGRRKSRYKLPDHYAHDGIIYPPAINLEQCSSEATARFKAKVIRDYLAEHGIAPGTGVDLSSGFGVDSYFMQQHFNIFHCVEPDGELQAIAQHNHVIMGGAKAEYHTQSAESFLATTMQSFDFVYLDPSRRHGTSKVIRFQDCLPNPIGLMPQLLQRSSLVLIKASPMLDVQQGLSELHSVEKVIVVSVDGECKEILFLCTQSHSIPVIEAVDLFSRTDECQRFVFAIDDERTARSEFADPKKYLYEPSPSILKAGAFKLVGSRYGLNKMSVNTHLYTSDQLVSGFQGRSFEIIKVNPAAADIAKHFPDRKANVAVRNYPLSPDALKRKWKIGDGGEEYLIGFSGVNKKFIVIARRRS